MEKIRWCLRKKDGIKFTKQEITLSKSFLQRAKNDFKSIESQNEVWKVVISYYSCYNALYSVLLRHGIKSGIHSCSIEMIKFFDDLKGFYKFMNELKENRINTQYYLKEPSIIKTEKVKMFLQMCEIIIRECNNDKIKRLKEMIK